MWESRSGFCLRRAEANGAEADNVLNQGVLREHSWPTCIMITFGLCLCITVDILQYSMPLAFLPSVLEDRGHAPMTIATAIGVYYWTGFVGCCLIAGYQVMRLLRSKGGGQEASTSVGEARKQMTYLVLGLGVGAVTLTGQALHPHCWVHTACRFTQGLAGSFIFFYAFLLCACLFKNEQKTFALTMASAALNVAEVLGSSVGAFLFDNWGQESVFFVLGGVSVLNQLLLVFVMTLIRGDGTVNIWYSEGGVRLTHMGWTRFKGVLSSARLGCAVLLIVMSAIVKGSVEEVLPFHADHRWHLQPLEIGNLFSIVAGSYIISALSFGPCWHLLVKGDIRALFCSFWLAFLAFVAWGVFLISQFYHHHWVLVVGLLAYGVGLGLTHTPATLLLGDAVEHEEGRAKDAVNGIFHMMWEAGGSLGFLLGGLLAEDYDKQLRLFGSYTICCVIVAICMLMIGGLRDKNLNRVQMNKPVYQSGTYGSMEKASSFDAYK